MKEQENSQQKNQQKENLEKKRLQKELEHLEKARKSGILPLQEYQTAKKSIEAKIRAADHRVKQQEAKQKAVEEILGASVLADSSAEKKAGKRHEKYFLKIEKAKEQKEAEKETRKTKIIEKEERETKIKKETERVHQETILKEPSISIEPGPLEPHYKDIDELVEQEDTNWRFALAILTIFLLILLYVKFTSFGAGTETITADAYLEYSSSYSHEMFAVLQKVKEEYEGAVLIEYHLLGEEAQSMLAAEAVACADEQERKQEYLDYLFSLEKGEWNSAKDLVSFAAALGYDEGAFQLCLEGQTKVPFVTQEQKNAEDLGITYAPTVVINNKKIVGAVDYEEVKAILDAEMTTLG